MRGVAAAFLAALALSASAYAAPLPRLQISENPLVIRGSGFQPRERIKLTVRADGTFVRRLIATSRGSFVARFPRIATDECTGFSANALGAHGSRASVLVTRTCASSDESSP